MSRLDTKQLRESFGLDVPPRNYETRSQLALRALCDRVEALEAALRFADEQAAFFLNEVLDAKHLGLVDRGDARCLREISQVARRVLEGDE